MLQIILNILVALAGIDADSERLRATAPAYLTPDAAVEHLWTARVAALESDVDPSIVLSIAWHESRYGRGATTIERGNRVSCGVMTPEPIARCRASTTLLDEYRDGARHLRAWFDACRGDRTCMLLGYAGGNALIAACRVGPVRRHGDTGDNLCRVVEVFDYRASIIRGATSRPQTQT